MKSSSAYWNLSQTRQVKANRVPLPHQCVLPLKAAMSVVLPDFLTLKTFLFLFSLARAVVCVHRCVCEPPSCSAAAAPGDSQGETCSCSAESHKEPLLSAGSWTGFSHAVHLLL